MTLPIPLPVLPGIPSDEVRRQVFSHSSSLVFTANEATPPQSNERLEFLGDSFINFCIANVLFREFPSLTPGELTALRSGIVSNANLNIWARAYGMQNNLVMSVSMAYLQVPQTAEKIIADVFEAYMGGVIVAHPNGRALVEQFLEELVGPTIAEHRDFLSSAVQIDKTAVSKLHQKAMAEKKKLKFNYVDSNATDPEDRWEAICLWEGEEVQRARARNQVEAKHRCAALVWNDHQSKLR
jgi:ribonuclease III